MIAFLTAGCGGDPTERCTELLSAGSYEDAVVECTDVYERTRDPEAGAGAAQALFRLGRGDEVQPWKDRLRGTDAEPEVLELVGYLRWQQGDVPGARAAYERQLRLYREAGEAARAAHSAYQIFQLEWELSRWSEALAAAAEAYALAVESGDRSRVAQVARGLYVVLVETGDLAAAERVLAARAELLDPGDGDQRARLLADEGAVHFFRGHLATARASFERALEAAAAHRDDEAWRGFFRPVHLSLSEVHLELGERRPAAEQLAAAERYAGPEATSTTALLAHHGRLELAHGDPAKAAEVLRRALDGEPSPDWVWELEYHLGRAAEAGGDPAGAEAAYRRSIAALETMRGELDVDRLKSWLLERRRQPFEALFRLLARQGRHRDALEVLESAKARAFLDAFVTAGDADVPDDTAPDAGTQPDETDPNGIASGEIAAASERTEALLELIPTLGRSEVVAPRPLPEVLAGIGRRHLLAYLETGDALWAVTVTPRGGSLKVGSHRLDALPAAVRTAIDRFRRRADAATAAELGSLLLRPELLPPPGEPLYVVADGALGRVPFAALGFDGGYLVERHAVSYVPSANALAALAARAPLAGGGDAPVVMGDPRGDLPAAERELVAVARRLGVSPRLGAAADAAALEDAADARLLHLATHTGLGERGPWLLLAGGRFGAEWLVRRGLGPHRVVLAGCASAARRGRGLWGSLGAAFLVAGSRSVVATLTSVEDVTTRRFVLDFYQQGETRTPEALAAVQRDWIDAGRPPAEWAPFVHLGVIDLQQDLEHDRRK